MLSACSPYRPAHLNSPFTECLVYTTPDQARFGGNESYVFSWDSEYLEAPDDPIKESGYRERVVTDKKLYIRCRTRRSER